jgi:recombination DNA repair RAD52 pathway protein
MDGADWRQQEQCEHRRYVEEYGMATTTKNTAAGGRDTRGTRKPVPRDQERQAEQRAAVQNLSLWQIVEKTDPQYTKPFSRGGGFRGTATNATYLAKKATEVFGPMGIGWGLEILDEAVMEGAPLDAQGNLEKIHKVRVKLWYRLDGERGEVVQFGQTTFVGRNRNGLFTDEEAPKKSLTDAMSKCLSLLGFSADIYLGRFDDNKYVNDLQQEFAEKHEAELRRQAPKVNEEQAVELEQLIADTETDGDKFRRFFKVENLRELPLEDYERARRMLEKKKQDRESAA